MSAIGFVSPEMLIGLIAIPPLAAWLFYREKVRNERLSLLGFPNLLLEFKRVWLPTLLCTLVLFALARPYIGYRDIEFKSFSSDIFVALDISDSMLVDDVRPSRLMFARRKILDLLEAVENSLAGSRIALILFSGEAYLFCPPTSDYSVLRAFVRSISPELISAHGSSLLDALSVARRTLKDSGIEQARILILSDGEDYLQDQARAGKYILKSDVEKAREDMLKIIDELDIPVDTIGIGTDVGKPIPAQNRSYVKDRKGKIVLSRLRAPVLKEISKESGGTYTRATLGTGDIQALVNRVRTALLPAEGIESDETSATLRKYKVYNELGPVLLMAALVIVCIVCYRGKLDYLFVLLALFSPLLWNIPGFAQPADDDSTVSGSESAAQVDAPPDYADINSYEAFRAYQSGDLKTALRGFEEAYRNRPDDNELRNALASVLYRMGEYERAAALFDRAARDAENGRVQFQSYYNKGTSLLRGQKFREAIESLDKALKIKPEDPQALFNRELAQQSLEAQKQQQSQDKDQKQSQDEDQKQSQDEDQQQSQDKEQQQSQSNQDKKDEGSSSEEQNQEPQKDSTQPDADADADEQGSSGDEQDESEQEQESSPEDSKEAQGSDSDQDGAENEDQSAQSRSDTGAAEKQREQSDQDSRGQSQQDHENKREQGDPQRESDSGGQDKKENAINGGDTGQSQQESNSESGSNGTQQLQEGDSLQQKEARAWLESLPDSPVLLHKQNNPKRNRWGITW